MERSQQTFHLYINQVNLTPIEYLNLLLLLRTKQSPSPVLEIHIHVVCILLYPEWIPYIKNGLVYFNMHWLYMYLHIQYFCSVCISMIKLWYFTIGFHSYEFENPTCMPLGAISFICTYDLMSRLEIRPPIRKPPSCLPQMLSERFKSQAKINVIFNFVGISYWQKRISF